MVPTLVTPDFGSQETFVTSVVPYGVDPGRVLEPPPSLGHFTSTS